MKFKEILKRASKDDDGAIEYLLRIYKPLLVKTSDDGVNFDEDLYQEQQMCLVHCIMKYVSNHSIQSE